MHLYVARIVQQKKLHFHAALIPICSGGVFIMALMLKLYCIALFQVWYYLPDKVYTLALEDEKCSSIE